MKHTTGVVLLRLQSVCSSVCAAVGVCVLDNVCVLPCVFVRWGVRPGVCVFIVVSLPVLCGLQFPTRCVYLEGALGHTVQLVVGQDQVPQVDQALEVRVVQRGEAVGVQVQRVKVLEVGEGVRSDLTDCVPAESQVDLKGETKRRRFVKGCHGSTRHRSS